MAGDDDAAAAPSDAGSADETMRLPRAPAAGLAARRAAQERTQLGHRSVREASTESAAELSGELLEEIIEPDVGEEALEYTSAGQWDVHEARKGSSVSPVKGKTSKKAAAVGDETDAPARPRARPKAGKSAAKASSSAPAKARAPAKGKKRAVEESDSSGSEYDAAPPLRVEKRTVQRTKATGGKRGPTSVVQQQVVERIPSAYHRGTSEESEGGVRRSGRYRYQPLEYWRGERARFGRPSMPAVREHAEDEEPIDGDAFERLPGKSYGAPPVPVLKEIVRIPRAEGEGTFAGMKRPRAKSAVPAGGNKPVVKRRKAGSVDEEVEFELDPTAPTVHPEDGWDKDTEPHGLVWDVDAESEVSRRIVCTSSQVRPRTAFNNSFAFEKVFGVDEFMAAGVLDIPVGGSKPTKPTKDNNYVFVVIEGAVRARVHRTNFHLAPGGIFLVPKGNTYSLENICQRPCRIFFSQARNTAALAPAAEAHTG
ncbi:hypothetical protein FA09DRAFT_5500 [Tilletiopsis washingtonensis]|uniref:CENP-C homolog n=1 Tax=Tilletiopsis washingtonensis TaxID=58919 RepID=A0A316ZLC4_9BASI|nr:hypothetical protein FA09DRAFT_5500 [Tilletiopsis washingtonensis]PWO01196.1 hypothetical protein FA09DRAFT_5500 [Tilletiopsis washingtonensis]